MTRDIRLDVLRVISMLAVIMIHVTAPFLIQNTFNIHDPRLWFINILNHSLFWCVPVFFMLSGALLLEKADEPISVFYKKRMKKIILPTLFWSAFFLVYLTIFKNFTLFNIVGSLFKGAPYYHLWFMYAIIGVYIFTPYLRVLLCNISLLQTKNLVILIFIFTIGSNYLAYYFNNQSTIFSSFISYIGYFILGHYLYKTKQNFKKYTTLYGSLFLISLFTVSIISIVTEHFIQIKIPIISYYSPLIAFQAIMLYLYITTKEFTIKRPELWIHLSIYSFGVYLIHPAFILLVEPTMTIKNIILLPAFFICVLLGSYTVIYSMSKIKYLKSIV